MPHHRAVIPALLTLLALSADAGITYRFTTKSNAALESSSGGRVWTDGDRRRVELEPDPANPRTYDVAITANAKTTFLNLQNKTYFNEQKGPDQAARSVGSSTLFHLPWPDDRIKGRPKISYRTAGAGPPVGGYATTSHVIQFAYRVRGQFQGVSLQGEVESTVSIFMAPALPNDAGRTFVHTGFREVDDELARHLSSLEGMLVGYEVSVSRKLEGGPVITETTTMSIDELKTVDLDDSIFVIPSGFTYQEPVFGFPGR